MLDQEAEAARKKRDIKGKIIGGIIVFGVLLLFFGHIPTNYYKTYKAVNTYETNVFACAENIEVSSTKAEKEEFLCNCLDGYHTAQREAAYRSTEDKEKIMLHSVNIEFFSEQKQRLGIAQTMSFCERQLTRAPIL